MMIMPVLSRAQGRALSIRIRPAGWCRGCTLTPPPAVIRGLPFGSHMIAYKLWRRRRMGSSILTVGNEDRRSACYASALSESES
jgi:hypothetical protein